MTLLHSRANTLMDLVNASKISIINCLKDDEQEKVSLLLNDRFNFTRQLVSLFEYEKDKSVLLDFLKKIQQDDQQLTELISKEQKKIKVVLQNAKNLECYS